MSKSRTTAVGTGAATGAAGGAIAGSVVPGVGTAAGAVVGGVVGGGAAYLSSRGAEEEADAKQAALDKWLAQRAALAQALADNYWKQGQEQQAGLSTQLQDMGSGSALRQATALTPEVQAALPVAPVGGDPRFQQAFANRATTDVTGMNAELAAQTAATRRRRFLQQLDANARKSQSGAQNNAAVYSRERFKNSLAANAADAQFQREYGDTPNSAVNQQMLGSLLNSGLNTGIMVAGRSGSAPKSKPYDDGTI